MTTLLRSLDLLVTRYHAAVLSMAAAVPQLAVGHDLRLVSLYQELGLAEDLFVKGGASPRCSPPSGSGWSGCSPTRRRSGPRSATATRCTPRRRGATASCCADSRCATGGVSRHGRPSPAHRRHRVPRRPGRPPPGRADRPPVVALVRAPDAQAASRRLARAWWDWPELAAGIASGRVLAVAGDVRAPGLGWTRPTGRGSRRVTHIVHAAADLRVAAPLAELRRTNVAAWPTCSSWPPPPTTTTASPGSPMCRPRTWPGCDPTRCPRTT